MKLTGIRATEVAITSGPRLNDGGVQVQVDMTHDQVRQAICVLLGSMPQEEASRFLRSEFEELFDNESVK